MMRNSVKFHISSVLTRVLLECAPWNHQPTHRFKLVNLSNLLLAFSRPSFALTKFLPRSHGPSSVNAAKIRHTRCVGPCVPGGPQMCGYTIPENERRAIGKGALYGEITPQGFATFARHVWLNEDDHFADLGSGLGHAAVQAVKDFNVAQAVGVELSQTRHNTAKRLLMKKPAHIAERVELVNGDCADESLWHPDSGPLSSVTCLYIGSLAFSDKLMRRIAQRIVERNKRSDDQCNCLRIFASLKEFPPGALGQGFCKLPPIECEMTWTAGSTEDVHIYVAT